MRANSALLLLVLLSGPGITQTITTLNLQNQSRNPDFSSSPFTRPITVGAAVPATCLVGQLLFNTAAPAGQNIFGCTQANTWVGFGVLPKADSVTLGGVTIPPNSGLVISSGALSVAYGNTASTALQGSTLGQPNGVASLDAGGSVPIVQLGHLGSAAFLGSGAFDAAGAAAAAVAGIPLSGPAAVRPALITPGDWVSFNSKQPALGFTPENAANKNARNGYAGLDANGFFPWVQLSGVPTASSLRAGILSSSDWSAFNAKQVALGFTPENSANKGQANGYAALNSNGQVPAAQLPAIPSNTSQLTNDAGFVNSAQARSAAPVQSVNGQIGAVTISAGQNYQTLQVNGSSVTQRPKLNFAAGANTIITASDNGTDTTILTVGGTGGALADPGSNGLVKRTGTNVTAVATAGSDYYAPGIKIANSDLNLTITSNTSGNAATATALAATPTACPGGQFVQQIGASGNPIACGSAVTGGPSLSSGSGRPVTGCSSSTVNSGYIQTGTTNNGNGSRLWLCSSFNGGFSWVLQSSSAVSVMSFGAVADGGTDDQPAIQKAINFAEMLNQYGSNHYGSVVYFPCGNYAVSQPIVLPKNGIYAQSSSGGTVQLVGENLTCTRLTGVGTGNWGILKSVVVSNGGSGYTSAPTVTFTAPAGGSCITLPSATAAISAGAVSTITVTGAGKCVGSPLIALTGGGGAGALARSVMNDAMIQWQVLPSTDLTGQLIANFTFSEPNVPGTGAIHYRYSFDPYSATGGNGVTYEREQYTRLEHLVFQGSNQYQPWDVYQEGDCLGCRALDLFSNPTTDTLTWDTVMLLTDVCDTNSIGSEGCGYQFGGHLEQVSAGGEAGGQASVFQGRLVTSTFQDGQCDGVSGINGNPYTTSYINPGTPTTPGFGGSQCYAFINSYRAIVRDLSNEGRGDNPQILIGGSQLMELSGLSAGSASDKGYGLGTGVLITHSSQTRWSINQFAAPVTIDSTSHNNVFLQTQTNAAGPITMSDTANNYAQYCVGSQCSNGGYSTLGSGAH